MTMYRIVLKIKSAKLLEKLPIRPTEGDKALITDTHELYEFKEGKWGKCGNTTLNMSLYEINQAAVSQLPKMDEETIAEKKQMIADYLKEVNDEYYMLLCRDLNYYTMFALEPESEYPKAEEEIIGCIQDLGSVISIERSAETGKVVEIWFKCADGTFVAYLFPYGKGVVKCQ